jgi:hypothetical protein
MGAGRDHRSAFAEEFVVVESGGQRGALSKDRGRNQVEMRVCHEGRGSGCS